MEERITDEQIRSLVRDYIDGGDIGELVQGYNELVPKILIHGDREAIDLLLGIDEKMSLVYAGYFSDEFLKEWLRDTVLNSYR